MSERIKALKLVREMAKAYEHVCPARSVAQVVDFFAAKKMQHDAIALVEQMISEAEAADANPLAKATLATEAFDGLHIETMMAISTAHVEETIMKLLMDDAVVLVNSRPFGEEGAAIYLPPDYDTWSLIRDDAQEGFAPKGLFEAMEHARNHGCTWLLLDSAAPEIEGLPTFDW